MINNLWQAFCLDGTLEIIEVNQGFPLIKVNNAHATATISLYGGQLLTFKPHTQKEPIIWLSKKAIFSKNKAIRGGIPICWPWFGAFEQHAFLEQELEQEPVFDSNIDTNSLPAHGYARISHWQIQATQVMPDGGTKIILSLPRDKIKPPYHLLARYYNCDLELTIIINQELKLELKTINRGQSIIPISQALHSYFTVSDIHNVEISGLEQSIYIDKLNAGKSSKQSSVLKFTAETDRVYLDSQQAVLLSDPGFERGIEVSKTDSLSTIIWNPWQEKTAQMNDMGETAWLNMVCIEPANVLHNQSSLSPGQSLKLSCQIHVDDA
ncbi:D-hexose-6-phosphate mutarotase [sulfur-oxidizing endosymbiont of Gigantopelta aegis]|uniref:D-hexose-6-phosphate mutarotase n=1 Tax=sulfur-oxidizing endosymbiont of Gigantopelta aegis TaxID=2794934 RepID=UPI0018DBEC4B|nr:D-hexose-6-phosphate mutarotase [sulfur-oxidizing endosymbiont of Gigantopelta aegis]